MSNTIIKLEGVDISQDDHKVFSNTSLEIKKGDFIYLIGETGSGKSSLLKVLYGEIKSDAGNIILDDINLNKITYKEIPHLRRKLGIIFQDFQLLSDRNIFDNLEFVLKATGWKDTVKINSRIDEVLNNVHLTGIKNKMPYELSGGEQQRTAIARALLNNPKIILADEPTGNLDPMKSEQIIQLLKEINENGTTIIIATHDYEVIKKFKSRIIRCSNKTICEIESHEL